MGNRLEIELRVLKSPDAVCKCLLLEETKKKKRHEMSAFGSTSLEFVYVEIGCSSIL